MDARVNWQILYEKMTNLSISYEKYEGTYSSDNV